MQTNTSRVETGVQDVEPTPSAGFIETYGAVFAFGFLWFMPAVILLGTQPSDSFNVVYSALLLLPLFLTPVAVVVTDKAGTDSFHFRVLALTAVAGVASLFAVIVGTPVVVYLFINQVGHDQSLTAAMTAAGLAAVGAPMLPAAFQAARAGRWARVAAMLAAMAGVAVLVFVTAGQGGFIADNLRDDQATIMMGVIGWCLPAFGLAAGLARRMGLV